MKISHLTTLLFVFLTAYTFALKKDPNDAGKVSHQVYFHSAKDEITEEQARRMDNLLSDQQVHTKSIRLVGHTDSDGGDSYNMELSKRRVAAVKRYLIDLGIPEDQIVTEYKGEREPDGDNASNDGKAKNRRVTIEWEFEEMGDIRDLYKLLEQEKQEFCFDPKEDNIFTLAQGTIIQIPAGTFASNCQECVKLRTKEFYKESDMVMENLSTTSNGRLLETGGMVYTEVEDCNGNKLNIRSGQRMNILLPTEDPRDDMELFYGERDPHNDLMNWLNAQNPQQGTGIRPLRDYGDCREVSTEVIPPCGERVPIFFGRLFGRMDESFQGMGSAEQRILNKEFRKCQKELRKGGGQRTRSVLGNCDSLYAEYGVSNWRELQDTLRKLEAQRLEKAIENGETTANALSYYVANVSQTGWMNCDAFSQFSLEDKIVMGTILNQNSEEDSQLIFKDRRSAMKPNPGTAKVRFAGILPGFAVWLLHLKYKGNRIFFGLKSTTTQKNGGGVEMREVSLDELKTELRKLDN